MLFTIRVWEYGGSVETIVGHIGPRAYLHVALGLNDPF